MPYTCSNCGQQHDNWPALIYSSPTHYNQLTEEDQETMGWLESDFCTITHDEEDVDRFVRVVMTIPVNDHCEDLEYGLWVSVSEKTFLDYQENYHREDHEVSYFGYVCNNLLGYEETLHVPSTVVTQSGNSRPYVVPHDDYEHPLVQDFYNGISKEEAERRIQEMIQLCS